MLSRHAGGQVHAGTRPRGAHLRLGLLAAAQPGAGASVRLGLTLVCPDLPDLAVEVPRSGGRMGADIANDLMEQYVAFDVLVHRYHSRKYGPHCAAFLPLVPFLLP